MRTTIAIATFLAVGAGAAGVGALNLLGSDTLKDMTVSMLTTASPDCGGTASGGSLVYLGTGSGNGEAALVANQQAVAPMSRLVNANVCGASQATAEGIVFELDGLSLVADEGKWNTCNGASQANCALINPAGGLSHNKVIDPYADFAGTTSGTCTVDANCNSPQRPGFFFGTCSAGACTYPANTCATDADCNTPTRPGVFGEVCESNKCVYHLDGTTGVSSSGGATTAPWKRVLRILFEGISGTDERPTSGGVSCPSDSIKGCSVSQGSRNCGSPERYYLAKHWTQLLQTCAAGDTTCPNGVQHAFRRNDESGTTDVFVGLITGPSITQRDNTSPFCNAGTKGPTYHAASPPNKECNLDTDCKAGAPAGMCATDATSSTGKRCNVQLNAPIGNASNLDSTMPATVGGRADAFPGIGAGTGAVAEFPANGIYRGEYWVDMQDRDVIRRACSGVGIPGSGTGEDVCSTRGDLGIVLPIWDMPLPASNGTGAPLADSFPTQRCSTGVFTCVPAIQTTAPGVNPPHFQRCPGGEDSEAAAGTNLCPSGAAGHQCAIPAIAAGTNPLDPRCVATRNDGYSGHPLIDGRAYNLIVWTSGSTPGTFVKAKVARATGLIPTLGNTIAADVNINMAGAFFRLHMNHVMPDAGTNPTCKKTSATDQIGCLVHASTCSVGYAGNAAAVPAQSVALKVNNVDPNNLCVQCFLDPTLCPSPYPLARKLYLNSLKGFESASVTADELKLAKCFSNGTAGGVATGLGFVPLPPTDAAKTAAKAFCEDFNEQTGCAAGSNSNACTGNDLITGTGVAANTIPSCKFGQDPTADSCHFGP